MIGRSGERWSGISVLAARHDDDDSISHIRIMGMLHMYLYCFCSFSGDILQLH